MIFFLDFCQNEVHFLIRNQGYVWWAEAETQDFNLQSHLDKVILPISFLNGWPT